jgi:hypothetical protein
MQCLRMVPQQQALTDWHSYTAWWGLLAMARSACSTHGKGSVAGVVCNA